MATNYRHGGSAHGSSNHPVSGSPISSCTEVGYVVPEKNKGLAIN